MGTSVPFLKGHMGGNEIVLVAREKFPGASELSLGLDILKKPWIRGDQLGLLYRTDGDSDLRVKIIDKNSGGYIPICGGLTQVLGQAELKIGLAELFGFGSPRVKGEIVLRTDLGKISVLMDSSEVVSVMDPYLISIREKGIEAGKVCGVNSYRVGDFFVTFAKEVKNQFPEVSFAPLNELAKKVLAELQEEFEKEFSLEQTNRDFALVELSDRPDRAGKLLFPHNISEGLVEPSCGTGTIAAAIAMHEAGLLAEEGRLKPKFETGGDSSSIGGPEETVVEFGYRSKELSSVRFSHNLVEILATGELYL
ncbi:hypothetical protein K9M06_00075 [Candidatus Bipolaricaulota bacterium]|nr:hypothetical protein [Candidatus Bipolaricaulota bacterium]